MLLGGACGSPGLFPPSSPHPRQGYLPAPVSLGWGGAEIEEMMELHAWERLKEPPASEGWQQPHVTGMACRGAVMQWAGFPGAKDRLLRRLLEPG